MGLWIIFFCNVFSRQATSLHTLAQWFRPTKHAKKKSRKKNPKTKARKLQKSEGKNKIANIKTDFLSHNDVPMYSRMSCIKKLRKFFRELFKRRPFKLAQRKFPGTKNIATNVENATVRRETKKSTGKLPESGSLNRREAVGKRMEYKTHQTFR